MVEPAKAIGPGLAGVIAGVLIWIIFDNLALGMIGGLFVGGAVAAQRQRKR